MKPRLHHAEGYFGSRTAERPRAGQRQPANRPRTRLRALGKGSGGRRVLDLTDLQARDTDQHREQALDLAERPGEGPAEGTVRPTPHLSLFERLFKRIRSQPPSRNDRAKSPTLPEPGDGRDPAGATACLTTQKD
jgi:hypothetical protein